MAESPNPRVHPNANGGPPLIDGVTIKEIRKMQAMRRVWLDSQNVRTPTELIAALHQIMFSDDNYESFQGTPTIARLCRVKKADTIQKALQTLEKRDLTISQSRGLGRSKLRRFQPQNLVEAEITKYVENLPTKRATRSKGLPIKRAGNVKNLPVEQVANLPNEQVGCEDSGQHLPVESPKPTRSTGVISDSKRKKDVESAATSESVARASDLSAADWSNASADEMKRLRDLLWEKAKGAINTQAINLEVMAEPMAWLNAGADLNLDVLPAVERVAFRQRNSGRSLISSWGYFQSAVLDHVKDRKARDKAITDAMGDALTDQPTENKPRSALHAIALRKQAEADAANGGAL